MLNDFKDEDFENKIAQTKNQQLINVRETFDQYNLISALHSFLAVKDDKYKNLFINGIYWSYFFYPFYGIFKTYFTYTK